MVVGYKMCVYYSVISYYVNIGVFVNIDVNIVVVNFDVFDGRVGLVVKMFGNFIIDRLV